MGAPKNRGYRRSWRNLLLDADYQLTFTLVMVGLSALVLVLLGGWVMRAADKSTSVSIDSVLGVGCAEPEPVASPAAVEVDDEPMQEGVEPEAAPAAPGEVVVEPPVVDIAAPPAPAAPSSAAIASYHLCVLQQAATIARLNAGRDRILWVLVSSGVLLCLGLFAYGIKMTHRVAGPLHKVSLYFAKLREGSYGDVHNLRKGDQLQKFYTRFRAAHDGLRRAEVEDLTQLRALLDAARRADAAAASPEVAAALRELELVVARKEAAGVE